MNQDHQSIVCPNCRAALAVNPGDPTVKCAYCGTVISTAAALGESDALRIEKMRADTYREVEHKKQENESLRLKYERELEKSRMAEEKAEKFRKSKLSKWLIVFSVISFLFAVGMFSGHRVFGGILCVLQTALFVTAYLMGRQVIPEYLKNQHIIPLIAAFLLVLPCMRAMGTEPHRAEKIVWKDMVLGEMLPQPSSRKGEIIDNSADSLWVCLNNVSSAQYSDYLSKCKEKGYDVEAEDTTFGYEAFHADGYHLKLDYDGSEKVMSIDLDKEEDLGTLTWPGKGPAALLPAPQTRSGKIKSDSSDHFFAYLKMTKEEFADYADQCSKKGFDENYSRGDAYYYAKNRDGVDLSLKYEGNGVAYVSVSIPEKESAAQGKKDAGNEAGSGGEAEADAETDRTNTDESIRAEAEAEPAAEDAGTADQSGEAKNDTAGEPLTAALPGIRPQIKEAIDSYENVMNEYCDFMESYDASDLSSMGSYLSLLQSYQDAMDKFEAIDEEELNDAELAYYTEVSVRVLNRLGSTTSGLGSE